MQAYLEIESKRPQLFNLACIYKLQDQNALQNYLIRDPLHEGLQRICLQLSAMKILFAALTEQKDPCTLPELLEGHVIETNMQHILNQLRATNFVSLIGVRIRSDALKKQLFSKTVTSTEKCLVPAIIGLTNQAMCKMFHCEYKNTKKRYRCAEQRQQHWAWQLCPLKLDCISLCMREVALKSQLCDDIQFPGHPMVPIPTQF